MVFLFFAMVLQGLLSNSFLLGQEDDNHFLHKIQHVEDVQNLFPKTPEQIELAIQQYSQEYLLAISQLQEIPDDERTYANTIRRLDEIKGLSNLSILARLFVAIEYTHPNEKMRLAARNGSIQINELAVDNFSSNVALYKAIKYYALYRAPQENLTAEESYLLNELLSDFQKNGLDLPREQLNEVRKLAKELSLLKMEFKSNVTNDHRSISVNLDDLEGLSNEFIEHLKIRNGAYIVGIDYPTFSYVMENCACQETRKRLFRAFDDRAYPANKELLSQVINKRDRLAKILGFSSYAEYDLSSQMVKSIENAENFIYSLLEKAQRKEQAEIKAFIDALDGTIELNSHGKLQPWDYSYGRNQLKKKFFQIDEMAIAEYFPIDQTINGLLDIFQQFFSLKFTQIKNGQFWHEDVKCIAVYSVHDEELLGYLLLDLHPRKNKYSHACHVALVPAFFKDNKKVPGVSLVVANLSKPLPNKPALFKREDMRTFFHEFGHSLHALLSKTTLVSHAGTLVKRDFVELPSQMLEQWLSDKNILKNLSGHYKTREQLPDELIDRILEMRTHSSGILISGQLFSALVSLELFKEGENKDIDGIYMQLYSLCKKSFAADEPNHKYASFDHLMGYGAKYYGYTWSKVFALDLFDTIKEHGLLNPEIGQKYVSEVLSKGGSQDPNDLLRNFLGRQPNEDAFLRTMGLDVL